MIPPLHMYAIRDNKADYYLTPYFAHSHGEASRIFADVVNSGNSQLPICNHPEDFTLHYLGELNIESGKFEPQALVLGSGIDVKISSSPADVIGSTSEFSKE